MPSVFPPLRASALSQMARLASGSVNEKDVRAAVAALHAIINNAGTYRQRAAPVSSAPACIVRGPGLAKIKVDVKCGALPAARYEVDETTLARELEQLGLPKGVPLSGHLHPSIRCAAPPCPAALSLVRHLCPGRAYHQ